MKFNLKNLNPGVWWTFPGQEDAIDELLDGGEEKKAKICLRIASVEDVRGIRAQTTTKVVEHKLLRDKKGPATAHTLIYNDRSPEQEREEQELLWDLAIVDWKNIEDSTGANIPCTKDNKIALMGGSPEFAAFVAECLVKLAELGSPEDEAAKNSKSSQSG